MARNISRIKHRQRDLLHQRDAADTFDLTTRTFRFTPGTIDIEKRSVEAVIATEQPVMVFDWQRFELMLEVLLMEGAKLPKKVSLLDTHDRTTVKKVLGSTREFRIENRELIGRNFFGRPQDAEDAWMQVQDGHIDDNSVGYRVLKSVMVNKGTTAVVNGRKFTAPADRDLRVSTQWQIRENSLCPIGADERAKHRSQSNQGAGGTGDGTGRPANPNQRKGQTMKDFEQWLEERGLQADQLTDEQTETLRADFEAWQTRQEPPGDTPPADPPPGDTPPADPPPEGSRDAPDPKRIAEEAVNRELTRQQAIRKEAGEDIPLEVQQRCIDERFTVEQTREVYLTYIRKNRAAGVPGVIVRDTEVNSRQLEAAMLLRSGLDGEELVRDADYGEEVVNRADQLRDVSLLDLCRHAIRLDGVEVPARRDDLIARAFSTASLPQLMSNTANKSLLIGYRMAPATWRLWCSIGNVSDFKTHTRIRKTYGGRFAKVTGTGEIKHGTLEEERETIKADTYADLLVIDRQSIINDDLGAFTTNPQDMGRDAAQELADLVYEVLMANGAMIDAVACFHADHSNLITSNALAKGAIEKSKYTFRQQTNKTGRPISIDPKFLLVPPELEATGEEFYQSELLVATGVESSAQRTPAKNIHKGTLQPVIDSRLSNSSFTNYSATTWYVMGDPKQGAKNVEAAFLNGVQEPVIRRFDLGMNYVGGLALQCYFDAGVDQMDYRTMQKSTA